MTFRKYNHLKRGADRATQDICHGTCYVFPKIDGTNASVWAEEAGSDAGLGYNVKAGSRNRVLSEDADNAGFLAWVMGDSDSAENLRILALKNPGCIIYGEWLVPHAIRNYNEDAWRRFYVFDVYDRITNRYLPYEEYAPELIDAGVDLIHPLAVLQGPTGPELDEVVEKNNYLLPEGVIGEGVVVKNYDWRNSFDEQTWMKIIRDGFQDKKGRPARGAEAGATEAAIAEEFVTEHLVQKNIAKNMQELANNLKVTISVDSLGEIGATCVAMTQEQMIEAHRGKIIPMTLGRVFHDLVTEEMGAIVKKFKKPTIDFRVLNAEVTKRIKVLAPELF